MLLGLKFLQPTALAQGFGDQGEDTNHATRLLSCGILYRTNVFAYHRANSAKGAPGNRGFYFEVKRGQRKKGERQTYSKARGSRRQKARVGVLPKGE